MNLKTIFKLAVVGLLSGGGCAKAPDWKGVRFTSPPCRIEQHGHNTNSYSGFALRNVAFNLGNYRSVQLRAGQDTNLALAVAISGGGQRAGNFGLGAMLQLERLIYNRTNNLLQEVDYFSTVSGGGLPVAGYVAGLLSLQATGGLAGTFRYSNVLYASCSTNRCWTCPASKVELDGGDCLYEAMRADYEAKLLEGLFHPSVLLSRYDRGDVLESHWDDRLLAVPPPRKSSLTLGDVFVPRLSPGRPRTPYWIANATVLGNGAIFPFTPDVVERYGVSYFNHQMKRRPLNCSYDLPLAVGLKTSASFPAAIPTTTLQLSNKLTNGQSAAYLQLSDGGLADNLGVWTAMEMLKGDEVRQRRVLIVIDAAADDGLPMTGSPGSPSLVKIIARTTDISLDSWRGRYRGVISNLCVQAGIKPVFLSFDELVTRDEAGISCTNLLGKLAERQQQSLRKARKQNPRLTQEDWFRLGLDRIRRKARATPTNLSITAEEQDMLVTAGRLLICLHEDRIRSALSPD